MKRFLFLIALVLFCVEGAVAQQIAFFEGDYSAIFTKNAMVISGDYDINLQEAGLSDRSTLNVISFASALDSGFGIRYTGLLPIQSSGDGLLSRQVTLNGVPYGPKDSNDTKHKVVFTQYRFTDHRIEIDFLPLMDRRQQVQQMYLIGSFDYASLNVSLKGMPNTVGPTEDSDPPPIETSIGVNKALLGIGVGGYWQRDRFLFKYKAIYDFLNEGRGWVVEADASYKPHRQGFIGVGGYYQDLNVPFDTARLKNRFGGGLFRVGIVF